ncbi:MAG: FtsX-like permease family protein [Acidobacteria bacterium]|nr:FtsX-like permease family protein [Acidobacteriota bacterium]
MNARNTRLRATTWVVRTRADPRRVSGIIARELQNTAGGLPVSRIRTMEEIVAATTRRAEFNMRLLTIFAGVALVLAMIGMYGLMSYSVQHRTQEIGIRMALGAVPADVRNMVVVQGMRLVLAGVALGSAAALVLSRLMVSLIFGVKTWDPIVFGVVASLLTIVAMLAAYVPALRATRDQPLEALRR